MAHDDTAAARLALLRRVADTLLDADGELPGEVRAAAFAHAAGAGGRPVPDAAPLPEPLAGFVAKVTAEAYRIDDADVDALRAAGYGDEAILEAVLATAVGAGVSRFEVGMDALAGRR